LNNILPPLLAILTIFFPIWFFSTLFVNALLALLERMSREKEAVGRKTLPGETT
jgi:hypothetical protein